MLSNHKKAKNIFLGKFTLIGNNWRVLVQVKLQKAFMCEVILR